MLDETEWKPPFATQSHLHRKPKNQPKALANRTREEERREERGRRENEGGEALTLPPESLDREGVKYFKGFEILDPENLGFIVVNIGTGTDVRPVKVAVVKKSPPWVCNNFIIVAATSNSELQLELFSICSLVIYAVSCLVALVF